MAGEGRGQLKKRALTKKKGMGMNGEDTEVVERGKSGSSFLLTRKNRVGGIGLRGLKKDKKSRRRRRYWLAREGAATKNRNLLLKRRAEK